MGKISRFFPFIRCIKDADENFLEIVVYMCVCGFHAMISTVLYLFMSTCRNDRVRMSAFSHSANNYSSSSGSGSGNSGTKRLFLAIELPEQLRQYCRNTIVQRFMPLDMDFDNNLERKNGTSVAKDDDNTSSSLSLLSCRSTSNDSSSKVNSRNDNDIHTSSSVKWVLDESMYHCTLQFLGDVEEDAIPNLCTVVRETCEKVKPFHASLGNLGFFPHSGNVENARVIKFEIHTRNVGDHEKQFKKQKEKKNRNWKHGKKLVREHCELSHLANLIGESTELLGFRKDRRHFNGHVTLGRVRENKSKYLDSNENSIESKRRRFRPMLLPVELQKLLLNEDVPSSTGTYTMLSRSKSIFLVQNVVLVNSFESKGQRKYEVIHEFSLNG